MEPETPPPPLSALIRAFVDGGMDAAVVVDRSLTVLYCNAAYVHLTGWRPREFERSKVPGMCHEHFGLQSCEDGCVAVRTMDAARATRLDEVRAKNLPLRLQIVAFPLLNEAGEVWGALEQYRDVTAESNMQEQYRRMLEAERAQRELLTLELAETNASSRDALEKERLLSQTDALTGLYNRRYFDRCFAERIVPALGGVTVLALIVFDLDKFKDVNDTYGHAGGDLTLKEFAKVLRGSARDQDVVARFGGEEFVMLISASSPNAARVVATRVLERVREQVRAGTLYTTSSGGIAMCPADGDNPEDLFKAADRALYAAKSGGRDRILAVEDLESAAPPDGPEPPHPPTETT